MRVVTGPGSTGPSPPMSSTSSPQGRLELGGTIGVVVRRAEDMPNAAVVVVNSDDEVTAEAFNAWLAQLQSGEPVHLDVTAAQTLAEARAAGEV